MIETKLATLPVAQYAERKNRFSHLQRLAGPCSVDEFPTYEKWCSFLPATAPSRHAITGCFLASFWEKVHCQINICSAQQFLMKIHGCLVTIHLPQQVCLPTYLAVEQLQPCIYVMDNSIIIVAQRKLFTCFFVFFLTLQQTSACPGVLTGGGSLSLVHCFVSLMEMDKLLSGSLQKI